MHTLMQMKYATGVVHRRRASRGEVHTGVKAITFQYILTLVY